VVTRALIALAFPGVAEVPISATPSTTVMLFSVVLAILTGVLFTVAPAWAMSKAAPLEALAGVGRNVHHKSFMPRRSLVVTQVALSFAMITSAGLLASSLANLQNQQLGFNPDHRLVIRIDPPASERTQERLWRLYERLRERIAREPGVANVSYALSSPMDGNNWSSGLTVAGRTADPVRADNTSWNRIGPGYFETVNSRLLRGRGFDERDVPGARRVAVVNETFARRFFDQTDPLGGAVGIGGPDHAGDFEIVGVVEDVKYTSVTRPVRPMLFIPGFQSGDYSDPTTRNVMLRSMMLRSLVVELRPGSSNIDASLRAAIAEINQDINVLRVLPLADQVSGNFRIERLLARLSSIYGGLALVLTALGLYGVTAYSVAQRRREIGVRMALGAEQRGIVRTVITGPVLETTAGLAIGLPLAMLVGQALGSQLYGLGGQSPSIWIVTIAILVLTSIVAAAIPARRAASIDPARALRGE
jgi:predicted permease